MVENQLPLILAHWELQLLPTARATNLSSLPPAAQDSCSQLLLRALLLPANFQQKASASLAAAQSTSCCQSAPSATSRAATCGVTQREEDADALLLAEVGARWWLSCPGALAMAAGPVLSLSSSAFTLWPSQPVHLSHLEHPHGIIE